MPSVKNKALGKEGFEFFFKKFLFAECLHRALGKDIFFKKNKSLPSAVSGALGKVFFLKKTLPSARSGTLGKEIPKKN